MGRTPKPLRILVDSSLDQTQFDLWREQGHTVDVIDCTHVDAIVGPKSWRLLPSMMKTSILNLMLRSFRKAVYDK